MRKKILDPEKKFLGPDFFFKPLPRDFVVGTRLAKETKIDHSSRLCRPFRDFTSVFFCIGF